jgi:hypothetical protein
MLVIVFIFVKIWRFLTILLTALSMSLSVCHLLEMPQRLKFDAELWVRVTVFENIFRYFGSIGALFEVGSVLTATVLIFLARGRGKSFYLTLSGAAFLVLAFAGWLMFVAPVNAELARWLTNPIPADFTGWRNQWEYAHTINAFIKIFGFSLLLLSVIVEIPETAD